MKALLMENSISYLSFLRSGTFAVYWVILIALGVSMGIMPFVYLDISVSSDGIIRPIHEKTDLRASSSGLIDSIYFKEGIPAKG
jgi:HlyD family secretion protein